MSSPPAAPAPPSPGKSALKDALASMGLAGTTALIAVNFTHPIETWKTRCVAVCLGQVCSGSKAIFFLVFLTAGQRPTQRQTQRRTQRQKTNERRIQAHFHKYCLHDGIHTPMSSRPASFCTHPSPRSISHRRTTMTMTMSSNVGVSSSKVLHWPVSFSHNQY